MQEEELFSLGRNLTEMESVLIQMKVHCEIALALQKDLEKLNEVLNFSSKEKISDEEAVGPSDDRVNLKGLADMNSCRFYFSNACRYLTIYHLNVL